MIPADVADIASIIDPNWSSLEDEASRNQILNIAWRLYNAGFRTREGSGD